MRKFNRREILLRSLMGMGSLPLRSLITGLPIPLLLGASDKVLAQQAEAKYLIISHKQQADPVTNNAPGTYAMDPNDQNDPLNLIDHPTVADLGALAEGYENPVDFTLGSTNVKAARPWSELDADLRARMAFWHHGTFTNAHPDFPSVMAFNGAIKGVDGSGADEFDAVIAQEMRSSLNTLLAEPISLGGTRIRYEGRDMPILAPLDIKNLFASQIANIEQMVALRDAYIDRAYNSVKQSGTPAQKAFLDRYAISQTEANNMGDGLADLIQDIDGKDQVNQVKMAVALLRLNLTPVVTLGIDFGGDNHNDLDLNLEVTETNAAVPTINLLWQELKSAGLQDKVIFTSLNTFGRTHKRNKGGGRDHNGQHHLSCVFGPNIKPGLIGGMEPFYRGNGDLRDFKATGINASSGLSDNGGDIPFEETLVAVGKTLAKAIGVSDERIAVRFDGGKVISAALTS